MHRADGRWAIADRWGLKPVQVAGLVVFGVASAAAGFVDSVGLMIAARVVAGVGAAMVMPVTLSVITSSFPRTRTQAIGIWSAMAGGGGLLGMIAGSAVGIALLGAVLTAAYRPRGAA
jgi:MFS family permease